MLFRDDACGNVEFLCEMDLDHDYLIDKEIGFSYTRKYENFKRFLGGNRATISELSKFFNTSFLSEWINKGVLKSYSYEQCENFVYFKDLEDFSLEYYGGKNPIRNIMFFYRETKLKEKFKKIIMCDISPKGDIQLIFVSNRELSKTLGLRGNTVNHWNVVSNDDTYKTLKCNYVRVLPLKTVISYIEEKEHFHKYLRFIYE